MDMADVVIVTRHLGLVEWLRLRGITGSVIAQVTERDIRGKVVVGVLPLHLASVADVVITVDMPKLLFEQRGKDLTPEEMDNAGAELKSYKVTAVPNPTYIQSSLF